MLNPKKSLIDLASTRSTPQHPFWEELGFLHLISRLPHVVPSETPWEVPQPLSPWPPRQPGRCHHKENQHAGPGTQLCLDASSLHHPTLVRPKPQLVGQTLKPKTHKTHKNFSKFPPFSLALSFNSFNQPDLLVGWDPQLLPRQFQEPVSLLRTSLSQIRDLSRRWSKQLLGPRWFLLPIRVPLTPARNSV